ncbi:serine hydroxymethyltransferase [Alicyclobacillus acidoterrestris]|uniref:Serine hydroxymethyltransferase n=1 Tax=Alicyclobacillus acidoterrestris (strain ATCC 49025 / DSM 3922 / CIP 106132 / NCIMB 13137 / GD3B) TaxID=1356854 RepID=A0A9E7CV16_ALIAG|nr:serine hydroxymethyltransferase [Alicyclobacillus acidoterrestris]UNO47663.1 serine hydroxymethyltransferase [Alicyclobacillus acidoterrestris]
MRLPFISSPFLHFSNCKGEIKLTSFSIIPDTSLDVKDPTLSGLLREEENRQRTKLPLIPSENYVSRAVREATGSVLTNKYSEGYIGKRYYEGQQWIDQVEQLAVDRAKAVFGVEHANVQPYSGSPANLAIYAAFLKPGDTVMGMALPMGGHLTHGWHVSVTGGWFRSVQYGVSKESGRIDLDEVRELAKKERPKLIFCGGTAVPREIDFSAFADIAREVDAILVADIAHIAGLIAGGVHQSPVGHAPIVSTTTHKTLRGPRGAMLMSTKEYAQSLDKAVFPGLQGGPHNHTTAAIAVCLHEAAQPEFKLYAQQVVQNAKALAEELLDRGYNLISGGTDNHLILIDLTSKDILGKRAAKALDQAGIVTNYNTIPYDPRKPFNPSGLRIGTPAVTSRGMGKEEMRLLAQYIDEAIQAAKRESEMELTRIAQAVANLAEQFPAPGL